MKNLKKIPKYFVLDVDGVMTDGNFYYSTRGKIIKAFGPDDHDALKFLKKYIHIEFITSDRMEGYKISKKRIQDDMGFKLTRVETQDRLKWISSKFELSRLIFMGDGIFDPRVMKKCFYAISTSDSDEYCKKSSDFITKKRGGNRAVAEACKHIAYEFFKKRII